jgi:hypothetical protein
MVLVPMVNSTDVTPLASIELSVPTLSRVILVLANSSPCFPNFLSVLASLRSRPGLLLAGRLPPWVSIRRWRCPGVVRTVRPHGLDGPRPIQMVWPL